jgi:hypothetical protein
MIAILDDDPQRMTAFTNTLSDLENPKVISFGDAHEMVGWLKDHLSECVLISLDHDLGTARSVDGKIVSPGTGYDVVEFLATQKPSCPVIVHTGDVLARDLMLKVLENAGWQVKAVVPYPPDLDWVSKDWKRAVKTHRGKR